MTVELRTHAASERAESERERIEGKVAAFETFAERVHDVSSDVGGKVGTGQQVGASAQSPTGRSPGNALAVGASSTGTAGGAAAVREAFCETVLPYAETDSPTEAMADELSPDLAAALSPAAGAFAPGLAAQLVSRAESRRDECELLADAIGTERDRLRAVADELDGITDWLAEADETPLLQLGFEELRERHDRLTAFRETCDRLARERQATVRGTRRDGLTGIRERELLDHLYADFADDHPALADLAQVDDLLADGQRAVRRHLCARV
ncbi:DUF7260 family protein [Halorussus salinisoli]|uniref:DUF7260 family protein n=1 Tax=Halorussus salinisoli TaxID=2558242 RepID=UPI0010C189FE|nr:hypothetical protein [Halorussus salinisoli]